jgi:translation elongation factor EF-G
MTRARPTILEPIMNVEVYRAVRLRRRFDGRSERPPWPHRRDGHREGPPPVIKAQVPMSEMLTYEQHLTSATEGGDLPHGVLALRGSAVAAADEDHLG